ncbi:MAG TPA: hypothetical protein VGC16_02420 [Rhizomicrobium sp.]
MTQGNNEGGDDEDEDARQRANLIALGLVVLLVAGSIWLIKSYMAGRDRMDCFLAGRHRCAAAETGQ